MSRTRLIVITVSVMLALFLAAVELTVVGTAMPTIISQLGGLAQYSWVFSVYALASTMMTPIFGRLSDQFGRRPIFLIGMAIFLVGSALSGLSQNMPQLILFRTIQGLGAGALIPLSFTIVGDVFTLKQRTRVQGLFSSVWGIASLIGPLVGGFLVDRASWRWVFYINIPFGILAMTMIWFSLKEPARDRSKQRIDFLGAGLLALSSVALLLAIQEGGRAWSWLSAPSIALLSLSAVGVALLMRVERRAPHPILELSLFQDPMFRVAAGQGFLAGFALFGITSFLPLYAQAVLGVNATTAGATLTPQILGWTVASIVGTPFILKVGYRRMVIGAMSVMVVGAALLAMQNASSSILSLAVSQVFYGAGMGLTLASLLIAVQNRVRRDQLGAATSGLTFTRTIGGALGVSIMGAILALGVTNGVAALGSAVSVAPEDLLNPVSAATIPPAVVEALREVLAAALHNVFLTALVSTLLAWVVVWFTPHGSVEELRATPEPPMVEAELPNL